MKDKHDRHIKHLRFSVTKECNYNCIYCDREGMLPKTTELTVEEITRLCKILSQILNVTRIKFTGGEPLLRDEMVSIIKNVSDLKLYDDISLVTNGYFLDDKVEDLKNAGLDRINVSLATLDSETYKKIYRVDGLDRVLNGLELAKTMNFKLIKLNYVALKGLNDDHLNDLLEFCAENDFTLQLIELHQAPNNGFENGGFYEQYHFPVEPLIDAFEKIATKVRIRGNMQNRKVLTLPNGAIVETIRPSHNFCLGCTKLRVGCDGNLFGCLHRADLGKNVKEALHKNFSLEKYEEIVKQVVNSREPYY